MFNSDNKTNNTEEDETKRKKETERNECKSKAERLYRRGEWH